MSNAISEVMYEYTGKGKIVLPNKVTHLRIHPSVTEVDSEAFYNCSKLIDVIFNDGLREIGDFAFYGCNSLQSINIPSTVTNISKYAFYNCAKLKEVLLNDGLTEIGDSAFQGCKALQRITIPSTVKEISQFAFSKCIGLRELVLSDGLKKIAGHSFQCCTSLQSIIIPSTVDEIGPNAFYSCSSLTEVVLNEGLKKIGRAAFKGCIELRSIKFPSLSTRLNNIIQAGQRGIEAKMDDIHAIEWRSGELSVPPIRREIENRRGWMDTFVKTDKEKLNMIVTLIRYYELKEATTLLELALWKAKIDQVDDADINRDARRIEVPGPVKDAILQYIGHTHNV